MLSSIILVTLPLPAQAQVVPGTTGGTPSSYEYSTVKPSNGTSITFGDPDLIAYLSISPNPVGVGQTVLVNIWMTVAPAAERQLQHYTVTFTKPDGTTDKIENLKSYEADGTSWFQYVVDQVGTWQAVFSFPGQFFPAGRYSNGIPTFNSTGTNYAYDMYYEPATSPTTNLTVQQEPVMSWYSPLPTDYWTRPISLNNREWNVIGGNYPWDKMRLAGSMNGAPSYLGPYITASHSAHVLWMRQDAFPTGIIGAEAGNYGNTGSGDTPTMIFEGRCYDTRTVRWYNGSLISCAICYDLRTGEMYYMNPTAAPFNGMTPTWIEYNKGTSASVEGGGDTNTFTASLKLISGNFMYVINPSTGAITSNITLGGLTATLRYGDWALMFQTNNTALFAANSTTGSAIIKWSTLGTSQDPASRIISNVTNAEFRSLATGGVDPEAGTNVVQTRFTIGSVGGGRLTGYSLNTGKMLWNNSYADSPFNPGTNCADDGKYFCVFENGIVRGFDALTGKTLWETKTDYPWGEFWTYYVASGPVDNRYPDAGVFIADSYAGTYAFNWSTGAIVWRSSHMAPPFETPYSINGTAGTSTFPGTGRPILVDGMVYIQANEHTPTAPYTRGFGTYCINASTGELKWMLDEPMILGAAADGYSTMADSYNGYMYVLGKGKSATTVSAPGTGVQLGQSVAITGTVTDLSPAQPGAACVSEASMGAYMSYLHLQSQLQNMLHPEGITGVPVSIDAIDPNGNFVHIADVTNDLSGVFSAAWKPEQVGKYVITATFAGSQSYGISFAETAISVDPAQATATPIPTQAAIVLPPYDLYFIIGVIAIIIALAIATVIIIRKK
jgi:outer membrane protein assembly factor BamB